MIDRETLMNLTTNIVSAYVLHQHLPVADLPALISRVGGSLAALAALAAPPPPVKPEPAVDVRHSITDPVLICLACGGKFRTIKRHLRLAHGLTPDGYRAAYDLPLNYPMIAPAYAAMRTNIARETGLGSYRPQPKPRRR